MSVLSGCQDARHMKTIEEIDCPRCHVQETIEVILQDGASIGDSICDSCGYVLPEGSHLMDEEL